MIETCKKFDVDIEKLTFKDGYYTKYIYGEAENIFEKYKIKDGYVVDFAKNDLIKIEEFQKLDSIKGDYRLKMKNINDKKSFFDELSNVFDASVEENTTVSGNDYVLGFLIIVFMYIVIAFIVMYDFLYSYKEIGIMKLMGYENKDILYRYIKPIVIKFGIILLVTLMSMLILNVKNMNYLIFNFIKEFMIVGIILLVSSCSFLILPFFQLRKYKVSSILKNEKTLKEIMIINGILKFLLTLVVAYMASTIYGQYRVEKLFYEDNIINWKNAKEYHILSSVGMIPFNTEELVKLNKDIYFKFNKSGSIFANFKDYKDEQIKNSQDFERSAIINPNYLKENPLYDKNGNFIKINENEENLIVLIPEKFKDRVADIKRRIGETYELTDSEMKIVFSKNNQEIFTYNAEINVEAGNKIRDPICAVITEKTVTNSL